MPRITRDIELCNPPFRPKDVIAFQDELQLTNPNARSHRKNLRRGVMRLHLEKDRDVVTITTNEAEIYASNSSNTIVFQYSLADFDKATDRQSYYKRKEVLLPPHTVNQLDHIMFPSSAFLSYNMVDESYPEQLLSRELWKNEIIARVKKELTRDEVLQLEQEQLDKENVEIRNIARRITERFPNHQVVLDELRPFGYRSATWLHFSLLSLVHDDYKDYCKTPPIKLNTALSELSVSPHCTSSRAAACICYICNENVKVPLQPSTKYCKGLFPVDNIPEMMTGLVYCERSHNNVIGDDVAQTMYNNTLGIHRGTFIRRAVNVAENVKKHLQ